MPDIDYEFPEEDMTPEQREEEKRYSQSEECKEHIERVRERCSHGAGIDMGPG